MDKYKTVKILLIIIQWIITVGILYHTNIDVLTIFVLLLVIYCDYVILTKRWIAIRENNIRIKNLEMKKLVATIIK